MTKNSTKIYVVNFETVFLSQKHLINNHKAIYHKIKFDRRLKQNKKK